MKLPKPTPPIDKEVVKKEYNALMALLKPVFPSISGFSNAEKYITGLLGPAERKNNWQLAALQGDKTPYALQQFIYRGKYAADDLRNILRSYISEKLGEDNGVLVVNEIGFLKQGKKSCGVKRQYNETTGHVENCQIGVFLTYASTKGHSPIDRRLYIPSDWIEDNSRCKGAGVPDSVQFKTKPEMALEMIKEATLAHVPYTWVTGNYTYVDPKDIYLWLENNEKCYVMGISGQTQVLKDSEQRTVETILESLPSEDWFEASCSIGSTEMRIYDWVFCDIDTSKPGWQRFLLVQRSKTNPSTICTYICFAPTNTQVKKCIEVVGTRWTVETWLKESKSRVGLDQYEVRSYDGWYKHITFACIALTLLTVLSWDALDTLPLREYDPASKSLDNFKKKCKLRV